MSLNRLVLVLNGSYEPIQLTSARRAMTLICKGAALVEEVSPYVVKTSQITLPIPEVIRLVRYRRVPRINRTVSRKGILLRDGYTCQYCGEKRGPRELTLDHVIPRSRSGQNTWENLVACCFPCNNRKGDRTPEEAGMELLHKPMRMSIHSKHRKLRTAETPSWDKYLFV